jgi:hypothetical protein
MKCNKHRYEDEIAAKLALANIGRKDSSRRAKSEKRYYYHNPQYGGCGYFHLTSQRYDPEKRRNSALQRQHNFA